MPNPHGRPPLPDDKRKGERLGIRLTAEEAALFRAAAEKAGLTLSYWARKAMREEAIVALNPIVLPPHKSRS